MSPIYPRTETEVLRPQRVVRRHSAELEFSPVTPADMERIYPYLERQNGRTTDFSYGGILMWSEVFKYEYCIYADTLFIKGVLENNLSIPAFSLPVGSLPLSDSVGLLSEYCRAQGIALEFSGVPEESLEDFRQLNPKAILRLEGWDDYLYEAESLAWLHGKKLGKKRNHVNRFEALYPDSRLEDLTPEAVDEVLAFMDIFDLEGDDTPMAVTERRMTRRLVEIMRADNDFMTGSILRVGNRIAAFTIGDIVGDTLFIHVEKALREFDGSYEAVNAYFARRMLLAHPELRYINREDDSGDPGLRQAKRSYHPVALLSKYNIFF